MAEEAHTTAGTEAHGGAAGAEVPHADPSALGFDATMLVALAMLVVAAIGVGLVTRSDHGHLQPGDPVLQHQLPRARVGGL